MSHRRKQYLAARAIALCAVTGLVLTACGTSSLDDYISADGTGFDSGRDSRVTDEVLAGLVAYPGLTAFALQSKYVTPTGLANLRFLPHLTRLSLGPMRVTDAGLAHVAALTELRSLRLGGCQLTDAGLVHLSRLYHLRELSLRDNVIGDAGLAHLSELTQLEVLGLRYTRPKTSECRIARYANGLRVRLTTLIPAAPAASFQVLPSSSACVV